MDQSPFREADRFSACQEIPRIFLNPTINYVNLQLPISFLYPEPDQSSPQLLEKDSPLRTSQGHYSVYLSRGSSGTLWCCLSNSTEECKFWTSLSSGMWHYAVWCIDVNVLGEPSDPIFTGEEWSWDLYIKLHDVTSHQTLIVAIAIRK
jgi:hypothetical protein